MTDERRTCGEWKALMPDALAGALNQTDSHALERHLDSCDECASDMRELHALWSGLNELSGVVDRPDAKTVLVERARAETASERPTRDSRPGGRSDGRARIVPLLSRAAVILLVFAGGFVTGRAGEGEPQEAPGQVASSESSYLLLLHENESYSGPPVEQAVAEYAAWAGDIAADGRLAGAEKLTDDAGVWLSGPAGQRLDGGAAGGAEPSAEAVAGRATGFFIIRAPSDAAAVEIASTTPHLKYGGVVQVREIEDISE